MRGKNEQFFCFYNQLEGTTCHTGRLIALVEGFNLQPFMQCFLLYPIFVFSGNPPKKNQSEEEENRKGKT